MSEIESIFQQYVTTVETLNQYFGNQFENLRKGETSSQYEFNTEIRGTDWLKNNLLPLSNILLPARFNLWLTVKVYDLQVALQLRGNSNTLEVDSESLEPIIGDPIGRLPSNAVAEFENFQNTFRRGEVGLPISTFFNSLDSLTTAGVSINVSLRIYLDKNKINKRFISIIKEDHRPKIFSFLFPESLAGILQRVTLPNFEKEYCEYGHQTVFLIFSNSGYLYNDLLTVCGKGYENKLATTITQPLSYEVLERNTKSREFRQSQGYWAFPCTWITPHTFSFMIEIAGESVISADISRQFKSFQALLSAIFLADSVEFSDGKYWIEYRGFGRVRLPLNREFFIENEHQLIALNELFVYSFEGYSPDKLEITQQFLSLLAEDPQKLLSKAVEVRDASKKTYERALVEKVKDYFDARHKIQERIKSAISDTSDSVISLTREVSSDLYKIAGLTAGVVIGVLLKPEIILWATFFGSLAISIYLILVIFYHLGTLTRAYDLSMEQHQAYIKSYSDILRTEEIQQFMGDDELGKAKKLFTEKRNWALVIYSLLLITSIVVVTISIFLII